VRTYARIRVDIWRDDEWRGLTPEAQWLFLLLLSQAKLSMAGCLDIKPRAWARQAYGVDAEAIGKWIDELEVAGMIACDWSTDELVVRTFVEHDGVLRNTNMGRGMWAGWQNIESRSLKQIVIDNLPAEAWDLKYCAPQEARRMRSGEG
jgi:hypothetical protein